MSPRNSRGRRFSEIASAQSNDLLDLMSSQSRSQWAISLPMTLAIVTIIGCSQRDDGRMQVYPVSGKVTVGGQPATGAKVVLYGATPELKGAGTIPPEGTTDENGAFALRSYEPEDGAPAGKFIVTILWPEPIPEGVDEEMFQPKDRLKDRYSNPETSGLTAEIPVGGGELPPFKLN
jgi:hypothetical protein